MWLHLPGLLLGHLLAGNAPAVAVHDGSSPQLAIDTRGTVRMVFGKADTIFAVTSLDQGKTFSTPVVVGVVHDMHLGNTRGPVLASSRSRTLVVAGDKGGSLHQFMLNHATNKWKELPRTLNDAPGSAPEGLITVSADSIDGFYATWLDTRIEKRNQLFFSKAATTPTDARWSPNIRVNTSPLGRACECCRPSIAVAQGSVAIMYRNNLDNSRDMYLTTSRDGGRTFAEMKRLGNGTWKLNGCPMDGGALGIGTAGKISTVWRRENVMYTAHPGETEVVLGNGRQPMMSVRGTSVLLIWQDGSHIKMKPAGGAETLVGDGKAPQVLALPDGRALTAWENDGRVYVRRME